MTAEIAILNKNGVALAADSKVTITGGKTFDTANKIFALSKFHPVGIMIFGNAEFMGYPWETLVKVYREKKRDQGEDTIPAWGDDFIKFVNSFRIFNEDERGENFEAVVDSWFSHIHQLALAELEERDEAPTQEVYNSTVVRLLNRHIRTFENRPKIFSDEYIATIHSKYADLAKTIVTRAWESENTRKVAMEFLWASIIRSSFSPNSSGIVIAGFGCEDLFPALVHYETDGYIGEEIKVSSRRTKNISTRLRSSILPFAQTEMVKRFMDGIDPEYTRFIHVMFAKSMVDACKTVLDTYGKEENKTEEVFSNIVTAAFESAKKTADEANKYQKKKFSDPIVGMISMLSKDELPNLAESLVALTSLKRHVSDDAETVGGPIDVALISKGDGFIWIKRKHYFNPDLNHPFFKNYFRHITRNGASDDSPATSNGNVRAKARRTPARANRGNSGSEAEKPRGA